MLPGALFCSATDANGAGDRLRGAAPIACETIRVTFARLRPPIEGGDWNDVLRARGKRRDPGAMSALTLTATNSNPVPENLGRSSAPLPAPLRLRDSGPDMPGQATIRPRLPHRPCARPGGG